MKVKFLGKKLINSFVLASGILGTNYEILKEAHRCGCGLVTLKSIGPAPREGHNNPTVLDYGSGLINAVGLPTPGYKDMDDEWDLLSKRNFPIIASIYGSSIKEFTDVAEFVAKRKPDFIEINVSCPNTKNEGMIFGIDEKSTFDVVKAVKNVVGKVPIIPKLTPQATDIGKVARVCERAGADAICAINTVGPGMLIDIETAKPILAYKKGGLSGPGIKPIAIRCVYDIYEAVKIPIIGMGGVTNFQDAIEMHMAGATLVGMGSSVYYHGKFVFEKMNDMMVGWLKERKLDIKSIIGKAHD